MTRSLWEHQTVEFERINIRVKRQVQIGTKTATTTQYKPPVTKLGTENEGGLAPSSRTQNHAQLTACVLERFMNKLNVWLQNNPRVIDMNGLLRDSASTAQLCADFIMDHWNTGKPLNYSSEKWFKMGVYNQNAKGYSYKALEMLYGIWREVLWNSIPYEYSEPYTVTTSTPIYTLVDDFEEAKVQNHSWMSRSLSTLLVGPWLKQFAKISLTE